jgi:hypothetical protein
VKSGAGPPDRQRRGPLAGTGRDRSTTEDLVMNEGLNAGTIDLIRWTFISDPGRRAEIEEHLTDLGLDVLVRDGDHFVVTWDEPEGNIDEVIEAIWAIHGEPFEITQEEFHRQNLLHIHHAEDGEAEARSVA